MADDIDEVFIPSKRESDRWTTQDELRFLNNEMIREWVITVYVRTGHAWCPNPAEVQGRYQLYLLGLEQRRRWDEIDREVVLDRCLGLIHSPPRVEVIEPPPTEHTQKAYPIVRVIHD